MSTEAEVIIIGSGMSGVAAALELTALGIKPMILDAGYEPKATQAKIDENLYDYCEKNEAFDLMLGEKYEGLRNLDPTRKYLPARLAAPGFQFITEGTDQYLPLREQGFSALQTLSKGGLGNAWGAGSYRFTDQDMKGFPIGPADLDPYYAKLTDEIGISGADDDLTPFFGSTEGLQAPLRLSRNAQDLERKYRAKKSKLNARHFFMGRPRFAILTERKGDRAPTRYQNLEFWQPHLPEIYTPAFTLDRLVREQKVEYRQGLVIQKWRKNGGRIEVIARRIGDSTEVTFRCSRLLLGAGAINTARLALASAGDRQTALPLLDNPTLQMPMILPGAIGRKLERQSFGSAHFITIFDYEEYSTPLQGAILDLTSPARGEFFTRFPLSASGNVQFIRYCLPAMMVMLVFFPSDVHPKGTLRLTESGELELRGAPNGISSSIIGRMARELWSIGAIAPPPLAVRIPTGGGVHYGGSLPMRATPTKRYETDKNGELFGEPGVFVLDGANLPTLPAKNYTFSVMANAMRIAHHVARGNG